MKNLTIARKLGVLTAVGMALLVVVALAGQTFTSRVADSATQLSRMPVAIRGVSNADMNHDATSSAVTLALSSTDPAQKATAAEDVKRFGKNLHDELDRAKSANVSSTVGRQVDALQPEVTKYVNLAQNVVALATYGQPTGDALVQFQAQFKVLERRIPQIADEVAKATAAAKAAAEQSRANGRTWTLLLAGAALVVLGGLSWVISRSILRPIRRTSDVLHAVAAGDLTARIEIESRDELAQMAEALNGALSVLAEALSQIGQHSGSLASASEQLTAVSSQLASTANETSVQAGVVSAAAGQVSENISVVAAGTGEMNASIQEISHGAQDAVNVADEAARVARTTNDTVTKLGVSSAEIGNVIKVITSIAEQTNLLALNATIEAARAGEAGKGFAVVAHEVKELASATASATADISERISAIQSDASEAVRAIGEITDIIGRVGETQASIASAVEEQTATTNEIGRNVAEASDNSTEIARNISGVAEAAESASIGAGNTLDTATELSRMAGELQVLVSGFRC